jgi:hypothetical protein
MEIYSIFPFKEDTAQVDSVIFINKNDIVINEFQPEEDKSAGVYSESSKKYHLGFSIKNLSELSQEELAKVKIDPEPPLDLNSKVILQLYKGSELSNETNFDQIEIYKIEKDKNDE